MPHKLGVFVINLDRSAERWEAIGKHLATLPWPATRIPAFDAEKDPQEILKQREQVLNYPPGGIDWNPLSLRMFSLAEEACFCSHLAALKSFLASDRDYGLILEDDAEPRRNVADELGEIFDSGLRFDIIKLEVTLRGRSRLVIVERKLADAFLVRSLQAALGTCAYLVTRAAARRLLAKAGRLCIPYDHYVTKTGLHGCAVFYLSPPLYCQSDAPSTLVPLRLRYKDTYRRSLRASLSRWYRQAYLQGLLWYKAITFPHFSLALRSMSWGARRVRISIMQEPDYGAFKPTRGQRKLLALAHASFLKRGFFRPFMARLVNAIRTGPIDTRFMDVAFRLRPLRASTDLGMLFNPDYNLPEISFLRDATPPGGIFVDVGSNNGMYALVLARHVGPQGKVIAIEPHPEALNYFSLNRAAAGLTNIDLVPVAVGERRGETMIETDEDNLSASGIAEDGIRVPLRPLLDIVSEAGVQKIDSLKIDIEGFEDRALPPFFAAAPPRLWPKAIVIEHLGRKRWKTDCIACMQDLGYAMIGRTRANTFMMWA